MNCSNFNLGAKMCFILSSYKYYNTSFSEFWLVYNKFYEPIYYFRITTARYSKELIANSLSFLEGIHEIERQVDIEKLSEHPCTLDVVDRSFEQPVQNACKNLSKEGLKIKFESVLTERKYQESTSCTNNWYRKIIKVVNCAVKKSEPRLISWGSISEIRES